MSHLGSLEDLLLKLGISFGFLNNAGNDSYYIVKALVMLVVNKWGSEDLVVASQAREQLLRGIVQAQRPNE
jgi:hypothetical protein